MYKKLLFPLAASAMLGGCANNAPLIAPDQLATPPASSCLKP
jgi:uncharacterized lipoprotein YajG